MAQQQGCGVDAGAIDEGAVETAQIFNLKPDFKNGRQSGVLCSACL